MFDMTVDYKVIELLCIVDEFCKHFDAENAGNLLEDRVKIILYQSNKVVFKVKVLSMFRRRNGDGWKGRKRSGGSPGSDWGRNKDEDDDHWWRRCIAVAAAMMRPAKYRMRRGR